MSFLLTGALVGLFGCSLEPIIYNPPKNLNDGLSASNHELKSSYLDNLLKELIEQKYTGIDSILISKKSTLIFESYFNGFTENDPHDLRSATKSIASLLAGIAVDRKHINSINDSIFSYLKEAPDNPEKGKIKVVDLLKMASGLDSDDWKKKSKGHERFMYKHNDWRKFMLNIPLVENPGEYFRYSTGGAFLLGQVIEDAAKEKVDAFAKNTLFDPLGIEKVEWEYTKAGQVDTGGHLKMRPRDMLKIGHLVLNKGVWKRKKIVSPDWVRLSTTKWAVAEDPYSYAFMWWIRDFEFKSHNFRTIFAWGNGGQFIFIIPELEAVVVFTGSNYNSEKTKQPFDILEKTIIPLLTEN